MRTPLLLALALVLAGCTSGDEPDAGTTTPTTTTPTASPAPTTPTPAPAVPDLALVASALPAVAIAGEAFSFNLSVTGEGTWESDHVGAHYDVNETPDPQGVYGRACDHATSTLPANLTVTCRILETGTYHLRGHVRLNVSGVEHHFWTEEETVTVREPVGQYVLLTSGVPIAPPVRPGSNFTFTLRIDGDAIDESDHIGGLFGRNTTDVPTVAAYPFACEHTAGPVPGEYQVTCPVPAGVEAGQYYLRGHMRITAGEAQHDFWADEETFVVL